MKPESPVILIVIALLPVSLCVQEQVTPVILVYSPGAPGYGQALKALIEEDDRFDAEVRICQTLRDFDVSMYFPDVKVAVVTLNTDIQQHLNRTLQDFFSQGGGLVGLGFAGSWGASKNASHDVFPIYGTSYRTPKYDPETRSFIMKLVKEEEDEISEGVETFSIPSHKIALSFSSSKNAYEPRFPETGDYKILFKESSTGAPAMVKYEERGVSVTFATFGADDFERGPAYYGLFVNRSEFRTLFTNSLHWVWENEHRFEQSVQDAAEFYSERTDHIDQVREDAESQESGAENARTMRLAATLLLAALGSIAALWMTFLRKPEGADGDEI
jgi:hypothetical protein